MCYNAFVLKGKVKRMKHINVISHRGANVYAPQNTLPAFQKALTLGVDGFETDVHITKDNELVLCHNYTIDKTSNGRGSISQMTLEELKRYDFGSYFSEKFAGTRMPTLREFLELVAESDIKVLNIELKSPKANETAIVRDTIRFVKEYGLFDKLLISSFDPKLIAEAKQIDPQTRTGFLYSPNSKVTFRVFRNPLEVAKSLNADALHPFSMYITEDLVKKTHEAGMQLNAWTINGPATIEKMIAFGVDGIITNFPDVVNGLLEKYGLR